MYNTIVNGKKLVKKGFKYWPRKDNRHRNFSQIIELFEINN